MIADWVRKTDDIYASIRKPVFKRCMCEFVTSKARLARNRYSHSYCMSYNKDVKHGADMRQKNHLYGAIREWLD